MTASALTGVLVAALILFALAWVLFEIVRQQGRILLRLESIEERLTGVTAFEALFRADRQDQNVGLESRADALRGMPPGERFSAFTLPDLDGHEISLDDYAGRQLLLVHWSPSCGFCDLIAGDLAAHESTLGEHGIDLLFASHGTADENRVLACEHGLKAPVLLQPEAAPLDEFRGLGTPVAYLLDNTGTVARPLAIGADEVVHLASALGQDRQPLPGEKPLADSKIERNGLKPGTPAPVFELLDINGGAVSLADFRGQRVVLVFTDPSCGPCNQLAAELGRVAPSEGEEAELIVVGRGKVDENRAKAREHNIRFPYVVQHGWRLSKQYGIFATPVAFLIDEQGVISREVMVGADAIRTLIAEVMSLELV